MSRGQRLGVTAIATAVVCFGLCAATLARTASYTLPPETARLQDTRDPGFPKAQALCSGCHSSDYIATQPPGKGLDFWAAEVNKMANVYGAPIPEEDRAAIAAYLRAAY